MPYVRTKNTPTAAETERWTRDHLARLGLKRGRKFRGGVCIHDPCAEEARRALSGVARRLEAVATAPVVPASRTIMLMNNTTTKRDTSNVLRDALRATDRLLARRRR